MKSITLTLPYPPSANKVWQNRVMNAKSAGGRPMSTTYVSADGKAFKKQVLELVHAAGINTPIIGRVHVDVKLYPHRPLDWQTRQRKAGAAWDDSVMCIDVDNANKVLLDSIKDLVIEDDKWVRKLTSERMEPDGHGARVVVTVTALATEKPQIAMFAEEAA